MRNVPFFFVLLFCILVGCSQPKPNIENKVTFDTIRVTRSHYFENDTMQPFCNLKMNFVYLSADENANVLKNINTVLKLAYFEDSVYVDYPTKDAIEKYWQDYTSKFDENVKFYTNKDLSVTFDDDLPAFSEQNDTINGSVVFNKGGILSFQVSRFIQKNDILYSSYKNYVFDMTTGNNINEKDIFEPNFADDLRPLFLDKIMSANGVKEVDSLAELGYLDLEEILPNNNFLIDNKGITYIFNRGEYSSPKLNEIRIFLSYNEIRPLLKKQSPISIFIGE